MSLGPNKLLIQLNFLTIDPLGTIITSIEVYRGPQGVRGSVSTRNTSRAPPEENSLGPDPLGDQQSSSEETHTPPSPAGEF